MKRVLTVLFVSAIALPLWSDEVKKDRDDAAKGSSAVRAGQKQPAVPAVTTLSPSPAPQDSILVQAARRANRKGKKPTLVITNESLKSSVGRGHITTTATQKPIVLPAAQPPLRPTPEMAAREASAAAKKADAVKAAETRKTEEARQQQRNAAANHEDEDLFNGENPEELSPGQGEPGSQSEQKPPQQ